MTERRTETPDTAVATPRHSHAHAPPSLSLSSGTVSNIRNQLFLYSQLSQTLQNCGFLHLTSKSENSCFFKVTHLKHKRNSFCPFNESENSCLCKVAHLKDRKTLFCPFNLKITEHMFFIVPHLKNMLRPFCLVKHLRHRITTVCAC